MEKIEITLAFDGEKLDALEYALRKERTTVQKQMDEARHTKAADSVEKKRDLEVQEDGDNRDGPVRERQ